VKFVPAFADTGFDYWTKIEPIGLTSTLEIGIGIVVASLATLRPLLRKVLEILQSHRSYTSSTWIGTSTSTVKHPVVSPFLISATEAKSTITTMAYNKENSVPNPESALRTFNTEKHLQETYIRPFSPTAPLEAQLQPITSPPLLPLHQNNSRDSFVRSTWLNNFAGPADNETVTTPSSLLRIVGREPQLQRLSLTTNTTSTTNRLSLGSPEDVNGQTGTPPLIQPLQEGYRRWVIDRPVLPELNPYVRSKTKY